VARKKKKRKVYENRTGAAARNADQVQEAVGKVAGHKNFEISGTVAKSAEEDDGQAKEAAADVAQFVQNGANAVDDLFRRTIEERPYTAAVGALAVGWVIGRMGRA